MKIGRGGVEIKERVPVRLTGGILKTVHDKRDASRVRLLRQVTNTHSITWVFEGHQLSAFFIHNRNKYNVHLVFWTRYIARNPRAMSLAKVCVEKRFSQTEQHDYGWLVQGKLVAGKNTEKARGRYRVLHHHDFQISSL